MPSNNCSDMSKGYVVIRNQLRNFLIVNPCARKKLCYIMSISQDYIHADAGDTCIDLEEVLQTVMKVSYGKK